MIMLADRLLQLGAEHGATEQAKRLIHPPRTAAAGSLLASMGDEAGHLHLMEAGAAYRWRDLRDGRRQWVSLAFDNELCDLDVLTTGRHCANLSALSVCRVVRLPLDPLRELLAAEPSLRSAFARLCAVERSMTNELIVSLGRRSATEGMAHIFCELAVRHGGVPASGEVRFPLPLTQSEVADLIGLSVVHVNRSLQGLKRQVGLRIKQRRVTVPRWAELVAVAGFDPAYLDLGGAGAAASTSARRLVSAQAV